MVMIVNDKAMQHKFAISLTNGEATNVTCDSIVTIYKFFLMPPKRKDSASTPVTSGPKQKRSKTSFRTPTTGLESTQAAPSEVGSSSTKNRVVTLRASASGRRGYRSQNLSTAPSSSHDSELAAEILVLPSDSIPPQALNLESDMQLGPDSSAKSRPKQKNTTTVR
jgi:hypothetical protein